MKLTYIEKNQLIKIEGPSNELFGFKKWLNRYEDGYMFDPRFKNKLWNGKNTKYDKKTDTIPMGLWKEAFNCCYENGYTFDFTNKKDFPLNRDLKKKEFYKWAEDFFSTYEFQPRPYQLECAWLILKNKFGNIAVATGGGKTFIYAIVFFYLKHLYKDKKFLLIVPSKTLVTQFYDDIIDYAHGKLDFNVREVFDITEKPRTRYEDKYVDIYIGTFQSLTDDEKYPRNWFKQFYMVTADECLHPKTLITMSDGTEKCIKDLKNGELVKTVNEETLEIENKPIEKVHYNLNKGQQMYEIEMEDGSKIKITGNHKIKLTDGSWIKAEDLTGDEDILYI